MSVAPFADPGASPDLVARVEKSRRFAYLEVIPFSLMTGLTEAFMVPYALALGANAFQSGLLTSVRNLVLSLAQLKSAEAVHWAGTRKRLILWTVGVQTLLWIPTAFVAPLFGPWAVGALVALYTLGMTSNAFGAPAWGSIVSEYMRPEDRGRFFGKRSLLLGIGTAVAGLIAGGVLQLLQDRVLLGFALLCLAAAAIRAFSWFMLRRLHELPWEEPKEERLTFVAFLRRAPRDNFGRFSLCMAFMSFGTFFSSPYVAVYMLEDLQYDYFTYSFVVLAGNLLGNLMLPRWGKIGDRHGNWVVMKWTFLGVSIIPALWALPGHPAWLLFLFLLGGFLWGGLNLCSVNFVYDAASPSERTRLLAYFNVVNGLGISAGTFAGGLTLDFLPRLFEGRTVWVALFLGSAVLRFAAAYLFPLLVKEVRSTDPVGLRRMTYDLVGLRVVQVLQWGATRTNEARRGFVERRRRPRRTARPGDGD